MRCMMTEIRNLKSEMKKMLPFEIRQGRSAQVFLIIVYCLIGVLGVLMVYFFPWHLFRIPDCLFRSIVGIPCPTCGMTRSSFALAHLDFFEAFRWNPLFMVSVLGFTGYAAIVLTLFGCGQRYIHWDLGDRQFQFLRWTIISVILINWVYLILFLD